MPKPTPRLSITSVSSDIVQKSETISAQIKEISKESIEEDVDFKQSKKFWESLESSSQSDAQPSSTPVPKPRSQIKSTQIIETQKADDSIGSAKSSSQSKISSEQQVEYSETSSIRTSLKEDDSELSDAKIELDEDTVPPEKKLEESEEQKDIEEGKGKESVQVGFYIGESSTNIITKSSTERRHDYAFDNEGYEGTFDEDRDIEELAYDGDEKQTVSKSEVSGEFVKQKSQETEKKEKLTEESTKTVKDYEIVEFEDFERRKSETKVVRQPSETRNDILECEYEAKSAEKDIKDEKEVSTSIKIHSAEEAKIESMDREFVTHNVYFEDQTLPILQEAVKEDIPKHVSQVLESQIYKTEEKDFKEKVDLTEKQIYIGEKVEDKSLTKDKTAIQTKKTMDKKESEQKSDKISSVKIETDSEKTVKRDQIEKDYMEKSILEKTETIKQDECRIEKDKFMEKKEELKKLEMTESKTTKEEQHVKKESTGKVESKTKYEPKLELNLEKSEIELSEKRFAKMSSKEEQSSLEKTTMKSFTAHDSKDDFRKSLLIDPSQVDQTMVEQTLAEVKESLDAVQEELIEVVKDGKLIKESPSEFEFKVLPHIRYTAKDTIQESYQEESTSEYKLIDKQEKSESGDKFEKSEAVDSSKTDDYPSISSTEDSSGKPEVIHRIRKEAILDPSKRWSVPEPDQSSSGDSHYQSFEKTDSRPLSSDVENLLTYGGSSEYQTAHDASLLPESTEYVSAVSTLDHSGKTISSHESMKSLDSESSANLGSIEVSEISETLVPSIADADIVEEMHEEELDSDENEMKLSTLEEKFCGVLMEDYQTTEPIQSQMKRSQEMTFKQETIEQSTDSPDITEDKDDFPTERKFSTSMDESRIFEESKIATSLEEGSVLSMSLSSTSCVDTVVENVEDLASSLGASSLTGQDIQSLIRDDYTGTSFEESFKSEKFDSMVMTSSLGKDDDTNYANTQITTVTVSTTEGSEFEPKRLKGHKRTESTAFASTDFLKEIEASKSKSGGAEGAGGSGYESPLEEEIVEIKTSKYVEEKKESESESDYDAYESEYARSYKVPTNQKKSKSKHVEPFEKDQEPEKRPFTPSQSVSETIIEDATEEIESLKIEEERRPSQNMQDYSNIPDITITEDLQKHEEEPEEEEDFREKVLYKVKTEEELHKAKDTPIHYAKEQEYAMSEDHYQELIQRQYDASIADITTKYSADAAAAQEEEKPDSPDSFEMLEQPDISDEFVIIEEVAKEANEFDMEGKSINIKNVKYVKKHDEEVEQIIVKSAPADPNQGSSMYMRDDVNFDFEESPPIASDQESADAREAAAANKKWVEMQLSDNASHLRYPYELERGVLEDIKEEDTEFEVGSSRISSFKDSFSSSTPEYDVLAGRKYFTKEHDDISMSSLQEFESLEQAISLENRKTHQGSQDSLSNGSFTRRYIARYGGQGDDISLSSLKEFEGLENACMEAHLIEIKAKEEAALLLSRSDESNKSSSGDEKGNSKPNVVTTTTVTTVKTTTTQPLTSETKTIVMTQREIEALIKSKLEECEEESSNIMEVSTDSLELGLKKSKSTNGSDKKGSGHGSCDSLEINKSADIMTRSIDSFDMSKDATGRSSRSDVDSLEQQILQDVRRDSIDSIEFEQALQMSKTELDLPSDTKDQKTTKTITTTIVQSQGPSSTTTTTKTITTISTSSLSSIASGSQQLQPQQQQQQQQYHYDETMTKDISSDSLNLQQTDPEQLLTSTESLDLHTSSTATNATYQNENDSLMSSSMTSCGSSTMIETLDSNLAEMFHGMSSSSRTSPFMLYDDSRLTQQQQQQQEQLLTTTSTTTITTTATSSTSRTQYIKDDEKQSYEHFEIFDKDSEKTDTLKTKTGEEAPVEPKPDDEKK